jgi:hypothetical protein
MQREEDQRILTDVVSNHHHKQEVLGFQEDVELAKAGYGAACLCPKTVY